MAHNIVSRMIDKLKSNGWVALSPLLVFLGVYLISSILAQDFYKVPTSAAFLIASAYAVLVSKEKTIEKNIEIFSSGAGNKNVLLMLWIFILAGAFAETAEQIGAIDATVAVTLAILPSEMLFAGLFIASCFISMAVGTSVGTIVALVPVAAGIATESGLDVGYVTAIVAGGAFFGDNLSFISDTTVAATKTQGCSMADKFKVNFRIVFPAAILVCIVYLVQGYGTVIPVVEGGVDWIKLFPYLVVVVMALCGVNVLVVLALGIVLNAIIGFSTGAFNWVDWLGGIGSGIAGMGDLIIVTILSGGMLAMISYNGGIDFLMKKLTRRINGKRGAELSIGALVSLANVCTANNTIAILTIGPIAKDIAAKFHLDSRKVASILDTFSCMAQGLLPYGAQMLMASGLSGVSALAIIQHLYYPMTIGLFAFLAIVFRFPKKYS